MRVWGILALLPALIYAQGADPTKVEHCERLATALDAFISDLYSPNALYSILNSIRYVRERDITKLEESSGYKLTTSPIERLAFSCRLIESKNRQEVARLLDVPEEEVDEMYEFLLEPLEIVGNVENLEDIANVASLLFEWAKLTGYPNIPFNGSYEQLTYLTFMEVSKEMQKKHVNIVFKNMPFPVNVSPQKVLKYFESAKTDSEFEKGTNMMPYTLKRFRRALKQRKDILARAPKNIQSTMELILALDSSGVLKLV